MLILTRLIFAGTYTFHSLEVYDDGCFPKPQAYSIAEGTSLIYGVTDQLWGNPGFPNASRVHQIATSAIWKWTWTPSSPNEDPPNSVEVTLLNTNRWDTYVACGPVPGIPGEYLAEVLIPGLFVNNTVTSTRNIVSSPPITGSDQKSNKGVAYLSHSNGVYYYTLTIYVASAGSSIRLINRPNYGYALPPPTGKCTWDVNVKPIDMGGQPLP